MGEFISQCMLSGLPITPGTRIRAIVIQEHMSQQDVPVGYGPHDWWQPRSLPLSGKYDGFGGITATNTPLRRVTLDAFKYDFVSCRRQTFHPDTGDWKDLMAALCNVEIVVDNNKFHSDVEQDRERLAIEKFNLTHGANISLPTPRTSSDEKTEPKEIEPKRVGIALIRADVWNATLEISRRLHGPCSWPANRLFPMDLRFGPAWHFGEVTRTYEYDVQYTKNASERRPAIKAICELVEITTLMCHVGKFWGPSAHNLPSHGGRWREFEHMNQAIHAIAARHRGRGYSR